jgi:SSS family solute:Na+ symporter
VATKRAHFGGSAFPLSKFGFDTPKTIYVGFVAVLVNLLVAVIATLILRAMKRPEGVDGTTNDDYFADEGDPRLEKSRTTPEGVGSST